MDLTSALGFTTARCGPFAAAVLDRVWPAVRRLVRRHPDGPLEPALPAPSERQGRPGRGPSPHGRSQRHLSRLPLRRPRLTNPTPDCRPGRPYTSLYRRCTGRGRVPPALCTHYLAAPRDGTGGSSPARTGTSPPGCSTACHRPSSAPLRFPSTAFPRTAGGVPQRLSSRYESEWVQERWSQPQPAAGMTTVRGSRWSSA